MNQMMQFFQSKYEIQNMSIDALVQGVEYDYDVQRSLKFTKSQKACMYIINSLLQKKGVFFGPIIVNQRLGKKGQTDYTVLSVVDGQHRIEGMRLAMESTRKKLADLNDLMKGIGSKHVLRQYFSANSVEKDVIRKERDATKRLYKQLTDTLVPVMVYVGLSLEEEKQMFHDVNTYSDKIPKSLAIDRDRRNIYNLLAKDIARDKLVSPLFTDNLHETRLKGNSVFTLKSIRLAIARFTGHKLTESTYQQWSDEVRTAFQIFVESLPDDYMDISKYFYHHAVLIESVMKFAGEMRMAPGVDWKLTLKQALATVPFEWKNKNFMKIGGATIKEDGTVAFGGSGIALRAMYTTLFELSDRLDSEGKDVVSAYAQAADVVEEIEDPLIQKMTEEQAQRYNGLLDVIRQHKRPMRLKDIQAVAAKDFESVAQLKECLEVMTSKGDLVLSVRSNRSKVYSIAG